MNITSVSSNLCVAGSNGYGVFHIACEFKVSLFCSALYIVPLLRSSIQGIYTTKKLPRSLINGHVHHPPHHLSAPDPA